MDEFIADNPGHPTNALHLFDFYIAPPYNENAEFIDKFFFAICETARHMKMSRVTVIAPSLAEQELLESLDFTKLAFEYYSTFRTRCGEVPYSPLRKIGENLIAYYEKPVEPLIPFEEMLIRDRDPLREIQDMAEGLIDKITKKICL